MKPKATTAKNSPVQNWPDFVTSDDLAEASELEREFNRLRQHQNSLMTNVVKEKFTHARDAYLQSPTDEAFEIMKTLVREVAILGAPDSPYPQLRGLVKEIIHDRVLVARFEPWARAIVERGLAKARAALADVIAREETHHFESTGERLGQQSNPIIEKARVPVRELENVLSSLLPSNDSVFLTFLNFLRARASNGGAT